MKQRAFEPYVTTKPKGTGLGLAIVKKIIDEHKGRITLDNLGQGGAVVTVVFPYWLKRKQTLIAPTEILVVDDEVGIRELLHEILEDEGFVVRLAENAGTARELRRKHNPSLVLLDI